MEVVQFPDRVGNIPAMLRQLADNIEAGTAYGKVLACAVVLDGDKLEVLGFGTASSITTHYMFALGQRKLENMTLEARDGT